MFKLFKNQLNNVISKIKEKKLTKEDLAKHMDALKIFLIKNDVALETAERVINEVYERVTGKKVLRFSSVDEFVKESLRQVLFEILVDVEEIDIFNVINENIKKGKVTKIVFIGINGVGKTLTLAKLAYLLKNRGYKVVLACSDTFRAGAIEQLEKHADEIGVKMIKRPYGSDPASVAYDAIMHAYARKLDVVIIDTAGRMHTNINLIDELRKIIRVVEPDLTILVVDALTGHDALIQSQQFLNEVGFDGVILTKVDANAKCGSIFSIIHQTRKPILFFGTGPSYSDLEKFDAKSFISKLFG